MQILELKIPPLIQIAVVAIAMWGIACLTPAAFIHIPGKIWLAGILATAGTFSAVLGVSAFQQAQTTVDPRVPSKTSQLVISGIYRVSRNPMYVGFLAILIAWAVYLSNLFAFVLLPAFVLYMNRFQIRPEERFMQKKFGSEYKKYQSRVRRWL